MGCDRCLMYCCRCIGNGPLDGSAWTAPTIGDAIHSAKYFGFYCRRRHSVMDIAHVFASKIISPPLRLPAAIIGNMCNRYNIKGTPKEIAEVLQATLPMDFEFPGDILPGYIAPGLLRN